MLSVHYDHPMEAQHVTQQQSSSITTNKAATIKKQAGWMECRVNSKLTMRSSGKSIRTFFLAYHLLLCMLVYFSN